MLNVHLMEGFQLKARKEKRLLTNRKIMLFLQTVCQHFFCSDTGRKVH